MAEGTRARGEGGAARWGGEGKEGEGALREENESGAQGGLRVRERSGRAETLSRCLYT